MSGFLWIFVLVGLLTFLGSTALFVVTIKYYWGERGTPPLTGNERRKQKEEEIRLRARQIEAARSRPYTPRSPSFWDNRKMP